MDDAAHAAHAATREIVMFELAGERFGIEIGDVREIAPVPLLTKVPAMPPWIVGVVNLRGEVLPVISLSLVLGLPEEEAPHRAMIVVEVAASPVGLMLGAVPRIAHAPIEAIEAVPDLVASRVNAEYLCGVIKDAAGLVILIDVAAVIRMRSLPHAEGAPAE